MNFLTNLNLNQNELQNVRLQNLAADPASPVVGQVWFNTTTSEFKFYDGTNTRSYLSKAEFETAIADYQLKITASGILKGNGSGTVTAAVAGTDYDFACLTGATDPTEATVGALTQHYLNTSSGVEFVCTGIDDSDTPTVYTWVKVSADDTKQDKITATGILKGDGDGGVTAAVADTDYQSVITVTAERALVSDANGKVSASAVTSTELSYLSGATSNIQDQLDAIPKLDYKEASACSVADGASQSDINTAAIAAITADYTTRSETPAKWDAVNVTITFTPSDVVKNGLYYYNGTNWIFLYYTTTGIQLASGITAGLIQEADVPAFDEEDTYAVGDRVKYNNHFYVCTVAVETAGEWTGTDNWAEIPFVSDLSLAGGVATVNQASKLRTPRNFSIQGNYGSTPSTDGIASTPVGFDGSGNAILIVTGIKPEMLSAVVPVEKGGTGKNSITNGKVLVGNSDGGFDELGIDSEVTDDSGNLITSGAVAAAIGGGDVAHKYTEQNALLTPTSGLCSWEVEHELNTTAVTVQVYEVSSGRQVIPEVTVTDADTVTIGINSTADIAADTYCVVVIG